MTGPAHHQPCAPSPATPVLPPQLLRRILPIAVTLSWLGPFSIDAYTPAFPAIQQGFATTTGAVQATLSTTLAGIALGQLLIGPVTDRFGRRMPLVVGLSGYVVASAFCSVAWTIDVLIVARFVQGLSAATGIAIARSIARDVHSGSGLARFYSLLTAATAIAPMVAPIAGAGILEIGLSWRWIFGLTLALGVVGLGLVVLALPETHPRLIGGTDADGSAQPDFRALLRRPNVLTSALIAGLCGGAMLAHVAGLPFFLQDERGLGPAGYSAVFAVNATGMVLASNTNRLFLRRWPARRILNVSIPTMLASGVLFALLLQAKAPLVTVLPALFLMVSTWGFVMPNAIAVGMAVERTAAGRASAILGATQFGISAFSAPLVGTVPVLAGVPPMATVIVVCLVGAAVVQLVARFVPAGQGEASRRAPARPW